MKLAMHKNHAKHPSEKPLETSAQRKAAMTSSFDVVAQVACVRKSNTEHVLSVVGKLMSTLQHNDTDSGTGALSAGSGNNNYNVGDILPNPPLAKDQNQKRHEPHASGAPTTKANKRAANASNRKRKEAAKDKVAHALGRI